MTSSQPKLTNAINRSRTRRAYVKRFQSTSTERAYLIVTDECHKYTVRFTEIEGERFGKCNCKAGVAQLACWHIVKAALADSALTGIPMRTA